MAGGVVSVETAPFSPVGVACSRDRDSIGAACPGPSKVEDSPDRATMPTLSDAIAPFSCVSVQPLEFANVLIHSGANERVGVCALRPVTG